MRHAFLMIGAVVVMAGLPAAMTLADAQTGATVEVKNFEFEDQDSGTPATTITAGETVTWVWTGGGHSVTEGQRDHTGDPVGPSLFDSGVRSTFYEDGEPVTTFSFTFEEPGVYKYYCRPHLQMEGVVVVLPN